MHDSAQHSRQIVITGELTIYTAKEWRDRLMNEMTGSDDIQVDLTDVSEIDSAGLQLLLSMQRQAGIEGRHLQFGQCSSAVSTLFDFTRLMPSLNSDPHNMAKGEQS